MIKAPAHMLERVELLQKIPENIWIQAGIATIIIITVVWLFFSFFLKNRFFSWLAGMPNLVILRQLDQSKHNATFEIAGTVNEQKTKLEYVLEIRSAATHTRYSVKTKITTTSGEDQRFYRITQTHGGRFHVTVPIPINSLKPGVGEFTRFTSARLYIFHRWTPFIDLGVNEFGTFCVQDNILGLTPDPEISGIPGGQVDKIDTLPSRHSKGMVPNVILILAYLFLSALPVVIPYLCLEKIFQLDRSRLELTLLDAQVALLNGNSDEADAILNSRWRPGSIAWYDGYENTHYECEKDYLQTWVKVRKETATAEDISRLYSGMPADIVKAEHFVRCGQVPEAIALYVPYFGYEGEFWRVIPSLMESIRFLEKQSGASVAISFAHECLAPVPDWRRQKYAAGELKEFLDYCANNPPPLAESE